MPTSVRREPHAPDENYEVDFRLANRSNVPLSAPKGLIVYVLTEDGTRYNPIGRAGRASLRCCGAALESNHDNAYIRHAD